MTEFEAHILKAHQETADLDRIREYRAKQQQQGSTQNLPMTQKDIFDRIIHRVRTFKEVDSSLSPMQSENFQKFLLGLLIQDVTDEQFETAVDASYKHATDATPTL